MRYGVIVLMMVKRHKYALLLPLTGNAHKETPTPREQAQGLGVGWCSR